MRRKRSVEEAKKRKTSLVFTIKMMAEKSSKEDFLSNLRNEGINLRYDDKKGVVVDMMDNEGNPHIYSLVKDLDIDLSTLPDLPSKPSVKDSIPPKVNPNIKSQVKGYSNTNPQSNHPILPNPIGINSGGSCGTNREWEVGTKKKRNPDDPDEEVKRKGMSY